MPFFTAASAGARFTAPVWDAAPTEDLFAPPAAAAPDAFPVAAPFPAGALAEPRFTAPDPEAVLAGDFFTPPDLEVATSTPDLTEALEAGVFLETG